MRWAVAISVLVLAGCAMPYQQAGYAGATAQQVAPNAYRIISRTGFNTSRAAVVDHTLLKAAETARQAGGTHFYIVSAAEASAAPYTTGSLPASAGGEIATTIYAPPHRYVTPGHDTYIRVISVPAGQGAPAGAFSADDIIHFLGRKLSRGST